MELCRLTCDRIRRLRWPLMWRSTFEQDVAGIRREYAAKEKTLIQYHVESVKADRARLKQTIGELMTVKARIGRSLDTISFSYTVAYEMIERLRCGDADYERELFRYFAEEVAHKMFNAYKVPDRG